MVCPACPVIAIAGGGVAGYFGFNGKVALVTASVLGVTTVALKLLFRVSLCDGNGNFSVRNIAQVGAISLVLGSVISVALNYLLQRCSSSSASSSPASSPLPLPS
jgi:hypothetical protein